MRRCFREFVIVLGMLGNVGFALSAAPAPDDHEARLALYAAATVGAEIAEQRCDGLKRNADTLTGLKYYAGIFSVDDEPLRREMESFRAEVEQQYAKLGTSAWCEAVWKALGSNGEIAGNVLVRAKAEPPALRK